MGLDEKYFLVKNFPCDHQPKIDENGFLSAKKSNVMSQFKGRYVHIWVYTRYVKSGNDTTRDKNVAASFGDCIAEINDQILMDKKDSIVLNKKMSYGRLEMAYYVGNSPTMKKEYFEDELIAPHGVSEGFRWRVIEDQIRSCGIKCTVENMLEKNKNALLEGEVLIFEQIPRKYILGFYTSEEWEQKLKNKGD